MKRLQIEKNNSIFSYELYKELACEICAPIDDVEMTLSLRFEIYQSKLIYLYNINEQCFRSINSNFDNKRLNYTHEDFLNIKNAIEMTREHLKQTIRESLMNSIKIVEMKGFYASRFQKNN